MYFILLFVAQHRRNIWFIRKDFVPFTRPHLPRDCYNGLRKAEHAFNMSRTPASTPGYHRCLVE